MPDQLAGEYDGANTIVSAIPVFSLLSGMVLWISGAFPDSKGFKWKSCRQSIDTQTVLTALYLNVLHKSDAILLKVSSVKINQN